MRVWPGNRLSADHRMRFKDVLRKAFGVLRVIFFFLKRTYSLLLVLCLVALGNTLGNRSINGSPVSLSLKF